jgi:hypothetical protein
LAEKWEEAKRKSAADDDDLDFGSGERRPSAAILEQGSILSIPISAGNF